METSGKIRTYTEVREGRIWDFVLALGMTALVARLFYKSWYAFVLILPIGYICRKYNQKKRDERQKRQLLKEFQSCMEMISANLLAGYALENSFVDAKKEMEVLYGKESQMCSELEKINRKVSMNQPVERVFEEFALQCGVKEIEDFSEILSFAKRSGGDLIAIIQGTVENIGSKIRIEEEIQSMIAEKKMEQKVMNVMPMFLLFYLDLMSPGYLDVLYGNLAGVLIMTFCLLVYLAAILLSERIAHIEV